MRVRLDKILKAHEADDADYFRSESGIRDRIKREFLNSEEILEALDDKDFRDTVFDYSVGEPREWRVTPVRTSQRFYIKKHTSSQRPYYHGHDFYEFVFVYKGSCSLYLPEEKSVRRIGKGEAFLTFPGAVHAIGRARAGDVVVKAVIPRKFAYVLGRYCGSESGHIFCKLNADAENYVYKAVEESFAGRKDSERAALDLLELVFIEISRGEDASAARDDNAVTDILYEYLEKNLTEASLKDFAAHAGYCAGYAGRTILRLTGVTFTELVEAKKFEEAKRMLRDTRLSVEEIAAALGYKNASGVYKLFARVLGTTPGRYRESET